jgi:DNA-binding transcriptional LysR family regulator
MDHLQAIRVFVRVVETGGFGRAALSLGMPNATASKWVKSLEAHLACKTAGAQYKASQRDNRWRCLL